MTLTAIQKFPLQDAITNAVGVYLNLYTVKTTRHRFAYGLFELVVDVGSSLGLWIGLSFLGVFDLVGTGLAWATTLVGSGKKK